MEHFQAQRPDVTVTMEHAGEYSQAAEKLRGPGRAGRRRTWPCWRSTPTSRRSLTCAPCSPWTPWPGGRSTASTPGSCATAGWRGSSLPSPSPALTPLLYLNADVLRGAGLPDALPAGGAGHLARLPRPVPAPRPRPVAPRGPSPSEIEAPEGGAGRALRHRPVAAGLRRVWRGHQLAGVPAAPVGLRRGLLGWSNGAPDHRARFGGGGAVPLRPGAPPSRRHRHPSGARSSSPGGSPCSPFPPPA